MLYFESEKTIQTGMAKRGNAGIGIVSTEEQWKNCISKPGCFSDCYDFKSVQYCQCH